MRSVGYSGLGRYATAGFSLISPSPRNRHLTRSTWRTIYTDFVFLFTALTSTVHSLAASSPVFLWSLNCNLCHFQSLISHGLLLKFPLYTTIHRNRPYRETTTIRPPKMHFRTFLSSAVLLIGPVFAQSASNSATTSTAATAPSSTTTDISTLVDQLPTCALPCLSSAATAINCTAADLPCLCSKSSELANNIGPCILFSSCSSTDQNSKWW